MSLDFSQGGFEQLFKSALLQGINMFCGAGFSVMSCDSEGRALPVGSGLLDELKSIFPSIAGYTDLSYASTKLIRTDRNTFYDYLKRRFSVSDFDSRYEVLGSIRIGRVYTTNIDDLLFRIFERFPSGRYLNDCSCNGAVYSDNDAIGYYPLHGCVRNGNDYVFGATELAGAFSRRGSEKSWADLRKDASDRPILFWGWNFKDPAPIRAMYGDGGGIDGNPMKWVLLRSPDAQTLDYLQTLGFGIIIGDTESMLDYIRSVVEEAGEFSLVSSSGAPELSRYCPPKNDASLPSYPLSSFFTDFIPRWSHVYSGMIPKVSNYRKIAESIASGLDTLVYGVRCSGKTTLMMQLLAEYQSVRDKHYLVAPSRAQVGRYLELLGERESLVFVDDCFRDTEALTLLGTPNVQVVAFDRDFSYERQCFKIEKFVYNAIDVTVITPEDAQLIVDAIPETVKLKGAGTRGFDRDPTLLNLLAKVLRPQEFKFMEGFASEDREAAKVFLMVAYVHACGVPCSFDMVYSFLGDEEYSYTEMLTVVERAGGLLRDACGDRGFANLGEQLEDYYMCRSRFLAERLIESIPEGDELFATVLEDFVRYVPAYKICNYDYFRRSGYDADFAKRAFPALERGEAYYSDAEMKDSSEYLYQQAAIYCSKLKEYQSAFIWIEKARNLDHVNRFSIQSTHARISFDVNLGSDQSLSEDALSSMEECCSSDKRKWIHYTNFAECCLRYYWRYKDDSHLESALRYVQEGLREKTRYLGVVNRRRLARLERRILGIIGDGSDNRSRC